jgi:integrase
MNAYARGKTGNLTIVVPQRAGYVLRSTGTHITDIVKDMRHMCRMLKREKQWWVLDALGANKVKLPQVYDHWSMKTLDVLKAELSDANLANYLDGWEQWVRSNRGDTGTAEMYRRQVGTLITGRFFTSELTTARVSQWLAEYRTGKRPRRLKNRAAADASSSGRPAKGDAGRVPAAAKPVSTGYKRKLLYAVFSFVSYLREMNVLDRNPLDNIKRPKKGKARLRWETVENDKRIVDASPPEYKALFAFIHATGAEISACLTMLRRDVSLEDALAHIPATKTAKRDRHDVLIESWAIPYLAAHLKGILPNARIWPDITRYQASWYHDSAAKAVKVPDYTLRDARHSWAVRARKRGVAFEAISEQLGSSVATVHAVYARFRPSIEERKEAVK